MIKVFVVPSSSYRIVSQRENQEARVRHKLKDLFISSPPPALEDRASIRRGVGVLSDMTVQAMTSQLPAVSEVAIAVTDSYLPVEDLQYFIDYIHTSTNLNWWAAIVVTTLLIRSLTVPLLVNQLKETAKLTLMRPQLEEFRKEMEDKDAVKGNLLANAPQCEIWTEYHEIGVGSVKAVSDYKIYMAGSILDLLHCIEC
ncbi:hypothetical protein M0R45_035688 [Rubus argutus]|uniref:Uncharacterized protein n=1 Tax=Rubus argutus TaxID=59490 RepID=A0AAW1VY44_RUBAR